jgi:GT2 family glycosyltransferase
MKTLDQITSDHREKVADKWASYIREYEHLFAPFRDEPVAILEVGVQNGGSLELWGEYFARATVVVGCDIDPACESLQFKTDRIHVVTGDANTAQCARRIAAISQSFDIIIDDGSHTSRDIIALFSRYFGLLKDDGLYVVEDLHCSYWKDYEGGLFYPYSSTSFLKALTDILNHEHWGIPRQRRELLIKYSDHYGVDFDEDVLAHIHSITFFNSLCVIQKANHRSGGLGRRRVTGNEANVYGEILPLMGSKSVSPDQEMEPWTRYAFSSEEQLISRINELDMSRHELERRIEELSQSLLGGAGQLDALRTTLAARDDELDKLRNALSARDGELDELRTALRARDGALESFGQRLAATTGEVLTLRRALTMREGQMAEYANRSALLDRLLASRSMRMTRPFRFVGRLLRGEWSLVLAGLRSTLGRYPSIAGVIARAAAMIRNPKAALRSLTMRHIVRAANMMRGRPPPQFISLESGSRLRHNSSFMTIVHLAKLFNARNARKAITYLRSGQLRLLLARARDLFIQTKSTHSSCSPSRDDGYLTSHPELTSAPKPLLDTVVSVVIPTYNGGPEFYWLIRKLRQQKGLRGIEIIVVDSGSTDDTTIVAGTLGCKVICIPKAQFSHSFSRNRGAEEARGDLLLFTVQDAHPIGDYWLYGLALCLLQPRGEGRLTAVSCTEYSRYDSEVLYDALINTHYNFLACRDRDRVGVFIGGTQIELRTQGQLSDVACLIHRDVFDKYKFEGRYAEDLTLGIRLIRDGHRIAMLSSIPVIHSHRRPADYYLRRVFVDVLFLADIFPDFVFPQLDSIQGALIAASTLYKALPKVMPSVDVSPDQALRLVIKKLQRWTPPNTNEHLREQEDFGFPPFGSWVARVAGTTRNMNPASVEQSVSRFKAAFLGRLSELESYIGGVYSTLDGSLTSEINDAVEKTLAMTLGAQIAFLYLAVKSGTHIDADSGLVMEVRDLLVEGV